MVVVGGAAGIGVDPIGVGPFEHVLKLVFLRNLETESGEMNFQITASARKTERRDGDTGPRLPIAPNEIVGALLGDNLFDDNGRLKFVWFDMRIQSNDSFGGHKPNSAIAAFETGRLRYAITLNTEKAVELAVKRRMNSIDSLLIKLVEFPFADAPDAFKATHPKIAEIIFDGFEHIVAEKAVFGGVLGESSVPQAKETVALSANPEIVCSIFVKGQDS